MGIDRDFVLLGHFCSLREALLERDALEERMRSGEAHEDLLARSLTAAEGVLQARSALYRCLMAQGWTPPETTAKTLAYDEIVLVEPVAAMRG